MATKKVKDKVLREPQSIDAEKAVLGSMLISKDAVPRAMNILIDNSFYYNFPYLNRILKVSKND